VSSTGNANDSLFVIAAALAIALTGVASVRFARR
jgi:LPXTG-motif cell wall-anchored protein